MTMTASGPAPSCKMRCVGFFLPKLVRMVLTMQQQQQNPHPWRQAWAGHSMQPRATAPLPRPVQPTPQLAPVPVKPAPASRQQAQPPSSSSMCGAPVNPPFPTQMGADPLANNSQYLVNFFFFRLTLFYFCKAVFCWKHYKTSVFSPRFQPCCVWLQAQAASRQPPPKKTTRLFCRRKRLSRVKTSMMVDHFGHHLPRTPKENFAHSTPKHVPLQPTSMQKKLFSRGGPAKDPDCEIKQKYRPHPGHNPQERPQEKAAWKQEDQTTSKGRER